MNMTDEHYEIHVFDDHCEIYEPDTNRVVVHCANREEAEEKAAELEGKWKIFHSS